jgi:flagellar motor switch protein FliM
MLEPIRDLIYSTMQGDQAEPDRRWQHMLQKQVQAADVEIVANLATIRLRIGELVNMKVGDVLPVELVPTIEAAVDGVPVLECRYGEINGRHALRVERVLRPDNDATQGVRHG